MMKIEKNKWAWRPKNEAIPTIVPSNDVKDKLKVDSLASIISHKGSSDDKN